MIHLNHILARTHVSSGFIYYIRQVNRSCKSNCTNSRSDNELVLSTVLWCDVIKMFHSDNLFFQQICLSKKAIYDWLQEVAYDFCNHPSRLSKPHLTQFALKIAYEVCFDCVSNWGVTISFVLIKAPRITLTEQFSFLFSWSDSDTVHPFLIFPQILNLS